jgi:hypothetical protein
MLVPQDMNHKEAVNHHAICHICTSSRVFHPAVESFGVIAL